MASTGANFLGKALGRDIDELEEEELQVAFEKGKGAASGKVWDQIATDEKGRRRFHGAFTGGFSAGHFNTVDTKEGWAPAAFTSSRSRRGDRRRQRPEDFMDEDDVEMAADLIKVTNEFSSGPPHHPSSSNQRHAASSTKPAEGPNSSAFPLATSQRALDLLEDVVSLSFAVEKHQSLGRKLLVAMGYRRSGAGGIEKPIATEVTFSSSAEAGSRAASGPRVVKEPAMPPPSTSTAGMSGEGVGDGDDASRFVQKQSGRAHRFALDLRYALAGKKDLRGLGFVGEALSKTQDLSAAWMDDPTAVATGAEELKNSSLLGLTPSSSLVPLDPSSSALVEVGDGSVTVRPTKKKREVLRMGDILEERVGRPRREGEVEMTHGGVLEDAEDEWGYLYGDTSFNKGEHFSELGGAAEDSASPQRGDAMSSSERGGEPRPLAARRKPRGICRSDGRPPLAGFRVVMEDASDGSSGGSSGGKVVRLPACWQVGKAPHSFRGRHRWRDFELREAAGQKSGSARFGVSKIDRVVESVRAHMMKLQGVEPVGEAEARVADRGKLLGEEKLVSRRKSIPPDTEKHSSRDVKFESRDTKHKEIVPEAKGGSLWKGVSEATKMDLLRSLSKGRGNTFVKGNESAPTAASQASSDLPYNLDPDKQKKFARYCEYREASEPEAEDERIKDLSVAEFESFERHYSRLKAKGTVNVLLAKFDKSDAGTASRASLTSLPPSSEPYRSRGVWLPESLLCKRLGIRPPEIDIGRAATSAGASNIVTDSQPLPSWASSFGVRGFAAPVDHVDEPPQAAQPTRSAPHPVVNSRPAAVQTKKDPASSAGVALPNVVHSQPAASVVGERPPMGLFEEIFGDSDGDDENEQ